MGGQKKSYACSFLWVVLLHPIHTAAVCGVRYIFIASNFSLTKCSLALLYLRLLYRDDKDSENSLSCSEDLSISLQRIKALVNWRYLPSSKEYPVHKGCLQRAKEGNGKIYWMCFSLCVIRICFVLNLRKLELLDMVANIKILICAVYNSCFYRHPWNTVNKQTHLLNSSGVQLTHRCPAAESSDHCWVVLSASGTRLHLGSVSLSTQK